MHTRIIFTLVCFITILNILACSENEVVRPTPEPVPRCSPYFIADYNTIVRIDRLKTGFSPELSGLCANFTNKYSHLNRCKGFRENTRTPETVDKDMVQAICSRNEQQSKAGVMQNKTPDDLLKFMVLDDQPFIEVREASFDFSARKAFSGGKITALTSLGDKTAYCLYTSSLPLKKEDLVLVQNTVDETKAGRRVLTFDASTYTGKNAVSISCVNVGAKKAPNAVLKKHFGKAIAL